MPKCAREHPSNEVTQLSIDAANVSLLFFNLSGRCTVQFRVREGSTWILVYHCLIHVLKVSVVMLWCVIAWSLLQAVGLVK